uniref:BTB domain-containing protein n=1 Tax=Ornithodoros turicata TaxID=34597 RepID=A0A2R5LEC4_9ACAR
MGSQQFCLKWNNHQSNMLAVFEQLLSNEAFVDVTLACEGLSLKAHKMVLSACSPFFQALFVENPCKHPIVILKDTRYMDLKAIVEFMYRGEVNVSQDQLSALLKTAETLKVKGLAEVTGENKQGVVPVGSTNGETQGTLTPRASSPPLGKRKRGRPRRRSASDSNRSDSEDQCSAATRVKGAPESPEIIEDGSLSSDRLAVPSPAKVAATSSRSLPAAPSEPSAAKDTVREDSMTVDDATGSPDDVEFEVDASNLMEQSMTTENVRVFSEIQSSTIPDAPHHTGSSQDATSVIPASLPSDISISQTQDIKPNPSSLVPYNDTTTTVVPTPVVPSQQASTSADGSSGGSFFMDSSGVAAIAGPSTYHSDKQPSTPSHGKHTHRVSTLRFFL